MKSIPLLSLFATILGLPIASTAPTESIARGESISTRCINTKYDQGGWFIGECLTGQDDTTRIQSSVYLRNKIVFHKISEDVRRLDFAVAGYNDGYSQSGNCWDCWLTNTTILTCKCNYVPGYLTYLDLESRIKVYNGHLLSDVIKPNPTPPATPSKYLFPSNDSDRRWGIGGNGTCEIPNLDPSVCEKLAPSCDGGVVAIDEAPTHCYQVFQSYFGPFYFRDLQLKGSAAWRLEGWDNDKCEGEPIVKIEPEQKDTCFKAGNLIRAVTIVPGWNGDPW
ncbi:hypothetical protein DM02DRAFT_677126 [Periconia macrospinosa]|uniref:Cyanovirin-N domain-containing protein n=1 Tax=Periconia macrospinosa TaxID=97972 RepID=A0A2V1D4N9_9PLEO|nr:hypothetical protein DM02DRAFT_677126 [Periconia macrospinosa]